MRSRSILAAGFAAAVALAAAGCGGGTPGPGSARGGAAAVVPADTAAFVALDTDLGSGQWRALDALFQKLPQHDALLTQLRQSFERHSKLSWANDVEPALGPELDVAALPAVSGGKLQAVVLTQPADAAKLDALLGKLGGSRPLTARVGGWTAISESKDALAAVTSATQHLADSSVYQEAAGTLGSDALVSAYANGAEARQVVSALGGTVPADRKQLVWAAADVVAASGGLRVVGHTRSEGGTVAQPYASQLVASIPSGVLAVADFQAPVGAGSAAAAPSSPLGGALQSLGNALGGETAVYVSPGVPIPALTLVTRSSDPQGVLDALHSALTSLGSAVGPAKTGSFDLGALLGALRLSHAVVGQDLVVSTSQQAIDAFRADGQKLGADGTFQEAQSAAGMPAKTTGFVYVNLKDALPAIQGLASLAGASLPTTDLSALRTLTVYGSGESGGIASFTAYLEVQ
jgi:hypothetical protein